MRIRGTGSGSTITERWIRDPDKDPLFPNVDQDQDPDPRQNEMDPKRWFLPSLSSLDQENSIMILRNGHIFLGNPVATNSVLSQHTKLTWQTYSWSTSWTCSRVPSRTCSRGGTCRPTQQQIRDLNNLLGYDFKMGSIEIADLFLPFPLPPTLLNWVDWAFI